MQEYPSNSNEVRKLRPVESDERPVVKKVTEGRVIRRKPPLGKRLRSMFFSEVDDRKGIFEYVVSDIMVPALKDLVEDALSETVHRTLRGDSAPPRRSSRPRIVGGTSHTSYDRYSSNRRDDRDRPPSGRRVYSSSEFYDIILESREDAMQVIDQLKGTIQRYDFVTVRELYEAVGEHFQSTDEKFGWVDLRTAGVKRVSNGGYLLVLPPPEPID